MARTMLNESNVEKYFWAEAINTACYIINRVSIRKILNKTPYELWKNKKPNISYFHIFGCFCYILNDKENLGKFDPKSDKGIFLGYSTNSKGYRIFNLKNKTMEISMHIIFDEFDNMDTKKDDDEEIPQEQKGTSNEDNIQASSSLKSWKISGDHPPEQILGNTSDGVRTRLSFKENDNNMAMISHIEPKKHN